MNFLSELSKKVGEAVSRAVGKPVEPDEAPQPAPAEPAAVAAATTAPVVQSIEWLDVGVPSASKASTKKPADVFVDVPIPEPEILRESAPKHEVISENPEAVALLLFLKDHTRLLKGQHRMLYVGYDPLIIREFRSLRHIDVEVAQPDMVISPRGRDANNLAFRSFDAVVCSHKFGASDEDYEGIREILRILKPGAWAILYAVSDVYLISAGFSVFNEVTIMELFKATGSKGERPYFCLKPSTSSARSKKADNRLADPMSSKERNEVMARFFSGKVE